MLGTWVICAKGEGVGMCVLLLCALCACWLGQSVVCVCVCAVVAWLWGVVLFFKENAGMVAPRVSSRVVWTEAVPSGGIHGVTGGRVCAHVVRE